MDEYIAIDGVSKRFGAVQALADVAMTIAKGEIHAIVGQNGAGKSTLLKILCGELKPDSGRISIGGKDLSEFGDSIHYRVKMVHQELTVFGNLTVAENMFPEYIFRSNTGIVSYRELYRKAQEQLRLFGVEIDPSERMERLSTAEQQIVEILRVISFDPDVVIFDEPTSSLNQREAESLHSILLKLKQRQLTILYISHRIKEVLDICDRLTVLKNGRNVGTMSIQDVNQSDVIRLMVGGDLESFFSLASRERADEAVAGERVFMELTDVTRFHSVNNINLKIYEHQVLGVFGLEGSGTSELSRVLFCLDDIERGTIAIRGAAHRRVSPMDLMEFGIVYLSNDRKKSGLFLNLSAAENIACPNLKRYSRFGMLEAEKVDEDTSLFVDRFGIVMPSVQTEVKALSGGNQQKLMLSICLSTDPVCIVLNEPTRGIDVGAKAEIYKWITQISTTATIILFSSELPELIALCDRIVVMRNRTVAGEVMRADFDEEALMAMAAGGTALPRVDS